MKLLTEDFHLKALEKMVKSGEVEITHIDSPPRTSSTALYRSLSHVYDVSIYEPFHEYPTLETGCKKIIEEVKKYKEKKRPIKILVKENARWFDNDDWRDWSDLTKHFITIMRDPHLQFYSYIKRKANDLLLGEGKAGLTDNKIWEKEEDIVHFLENGRTKSTSRDIPGNFESLSWSPLSNHMNILRTRQLHQENGKTLSVVSAFLLRISPELIMKNLLTTLGIENTPEKITETIQWNESSVDKIATTNKRAHSAYTEAVRKSNGYTLPNDTTYSIDRFSQKLQNYLLETALPVYIDFLKWPHKIGVKSLMEAENLFSLQNSEGTTMEECNPVEAYAIIATLPTEVNSRESIDRKLTELREKFPQHQRAFQCIDSAAQGLNTPQPELSTPLDLVQDEPKNIMRA